MILTEPELTRWGRAVGRDLDPPAVLTLSGPLGAGKSVLARAIAHGAGVEGPVPSPTYNLIFRYPASRGREVVHLDLYRLRDPSELGELGWDELPGPRDLVLVEWPERAEGFLPRERWEIELGFPSGRPHLRELRVHPTASGLARLPQIV